MALTVVEYTIQAPGGGNEVLAPGDFLFQGGSNDGVTWDTLDTQIGQVYLASEIKVFNVVDTASYRRHRFWITDTDATPGSTSTGALEIQLRAVPAGADLTPTMTSNILPNPWVTSADGEWGTYAAWKAFNDSALGEYWLVGGALPHWIAIDDGVDAPPLIHTLLPIAGDVGDPVVIAGMNFGAVQGASTVTFNGTDAGAATLWSDISITVDVPAGATTGDVIVTVGGVPSVGYPFTVNAPPAPPGPGGGPWIVSGWDSTDTAGTPRGGRIVGEDGTVYNYDESGVLASTGLTADVPVHSTGRFKKEDSTDTNIADDLERRQ